MKQVLIFRRGELSLKDKKRLTDSGIVWVECEHPNDVVQMSMVNIELPNSVLLKAAVAGANYSASSAKAMIEVLEKEMESISLPNTEEKEMP